MIKEDELIENFLLSLIDKKKKVDSSYFLIKLLENLHYFGSVTQRLNNLSIKNLITWDNAIPDESFKSMNNIMLTGLGKKKLKLVDLSLLFDELKEILPSTSLLDKIKEHLISSL